jgi:UDP-N-acetylglucosamine--N-acetylmuramyl-(pentapeptide) pyrophosphoryl-undecaprenol N-acetylglucosamine transferase
VKVVVAGGGTAGHVFPAIALARRLIDDHGADVRYLGTTAGLESRLVPEAGIPFTAIEAQPLERKLSAKSVAAPLITARAVRASRPLVLDADVVVGMGGYVSVPPVLAAARAHRPIVLHEQNAIPGLANRLLARFASAVAVSFGDARARLPRSTRTVLTGNPVRASIADVAERREAVAKEAWTALDLDERRRTVVVFGGSLGALHLDRTIAGALEALEERDDLQLLVVTGPAHLDVVAASARPGVPLLVRAVPFLDRMELAYAVADLVVARAGATTIAEIAVCGLPSILVPFPFATANHQEANARELERVGASSVLLDGDLEPVALALQIADLVDDAARLRAMAESARAWARPDAAARLADLVVEAA